MPRRRKDAVDPAVQEAVEEAVDEAVEDAADDLAEEVAEEVAEDVSEQVEAHADDARGAARRAKRAESGARKAAAGAAEARRGAVDAGRAAVEAAEAVAPDDPLVDTAVRRIEAQADEENPFGRPGRPLSSRSPFRIAFTAALGVATAYALVSALIAVRSVLVLLLIAAFLAIGLSPAVDALQRRGVVRGRAVGIVLLAVLAFFTGFAMAVVPPIVDQANELVEAAPDYLKQLQQNESLARLDERYGVLQRAQAFLEEPERIGSTVFGGVLGVGKVVFSAFFSTLTVLILMLYFMANLPDIKATAYRLVPRTRRARVGLLTDEILSRVGGYVAGALGIAAINGLLTFLVLALLRVDYPVALAMVVAVFGLVPLIGATIGAVIVTTIAFFTSVQAGVVLVVYYLVYQQVENYVLYPRIMKRSVDVSPAATVVAVLIGGSLMGVVGALLAIPVAAAVQLVLQEVVMPRQDVI